MPRGSTRRPGRRYLGTRVRFDEPTKAMLLELLGQEKERLLELGARVPTVYDRIITSAEQNATRLSQHPIQQRLEFVVELINRLETSKAG